MQYLLVVLSALGLFAAVNSTPCHQYSQKIESPCNEVIDAKHGYEIRDYSANNTIFYTSAYVSSSCFGVAAKQGFDKNFAYISGKNSKNETIPMTAPVTFRRDHATDGYLVGFFIPSTYDTAKDIPKPRDSSIGIVSFPKDATFAVVSFGGFAGPNDFKDHQHDLTTKLAADKVEVVHDEWITVWASYDSPFQLFDRHNEVWVHVKASGNSSTDSFAEHSDWGNTFTMME